MLMKVRLKSQTVLSKLIEGIDLKSVDMQYRIYRLHLEGQQTEVTEGDGEDELPATSHWILPSADLHGLWENQIYE
jgi:hypothetical protein